jgi:hypothetical protein
MEGVMGKVVLVVCFIFGYNMGVAMDQESFLLNKLNGTYKEAWHTMADAEKFAIDGRSGAIGDEVNLKLGGILNSLMSTSPLAKAQSIAMLAAASPLFMPYNPEASLMCMNRMFEIAGSKSNFDLAKFLLYSQSKDGNSYDFPEKLTPTNYKILEKAINMFCSEHNGSVASARQELETLKNTKNDTVRAILKMFGIIE